MIKDSADYLEKKQFFDSILTIYGRKPVAEALADTSLEIYRLHLADSNKPDGIIKEVIQLAEQRGIEIYYHNKKALSRISKNAKQDQGVAADIKLKHLLTLDSFLQQQRSTFKVLALDAITNPQNLGMIIRSACAGNIDAILIPKNGCASLNALVIKASVGTLFKAPLIRCDDLPTALTQLKSHAKICVLSLQAKQSLFESHQQQSRVYVLGNESDGVSQRIMTMADEKFIIPMNNGVESLNVAVTAALIAFLS